MNDMVVSANQAILKANVWMLKKDMLVKDETDGVTSNVKNLLVSHCSAKVVWKVLPSKIGFVIACCQVWFPMVKESGVNRGCNRVVYEIVWTFGRKCSDIEWWKSEGFVSGCPTPAISRCDAIHLCLQGNIVIFILILVADDERMVAWFMVNSSGGGRWRW